MSLGRVIMGSREIADATGRAIAARVNTSGAGGAVVLFNPSAEPISEYVEYEPWTEWQLWAPNGWGLTDEAGRAVSHQLIETHEALTRATSGISRIVFRAELPAFGYRVYRFAPVLTARAPVIEAVGAAQATEAGLENDLFALRLDPATGAVVSCIDSATGLELVGPNGWNVAQVIEDTSDTWSHRVARFDQVIGAFGDAKLTVYERGPLEASLLVERRYEGNVWLQQIVVRHGDPQIMIRNWLNWQGQWRMLKLAFDLPTDAPQAAHDVAFGWCVRPTNGQEFPTHMWMDVSGPARAGDDRRIGLAVLNDGKYSCDVTGSTARLTILRCPPYAYHEPHVFGARARYDWVDQGYQEFTVALRPHVGDWRDAGVVPAARLLNVPILPVTMHCHNGDLSPAASLLGLSSPEMELTALKTAEDGDGFVVRVADRHARGGAGELHWHGAAFPLSLAPFEVVTLRLTQRDGRWQTQPCDMLERPLV
jgi:alpha-mannosidase